MDFLIVDLTHGGVIIANELVNNLTNNLINSKTIDLSNVTNIRNLTNFKDSKIATNRNTTINVNQVFAFDIYNTYNPINTDSKLSDNIIHIKDLLELDNYNPHDLVIISPVHCNFKVPSKLNNIIHSYLTHHEAINMILSQKSPVANNIIEVTGVKGKTSVVGILEKILKNNNLLILSSLGAKTIYNNYENIGEKDNTKNCTNIENNNETKSNETILKKTISITPASIIETINLAKSKNKNINANSEFDIAIFESSLGGTGNADIGVLTNITENYSICNNSKRASDAKRQIFDSKIVVCEYETLNNYYNEYNTNKKENSIINTFSIDSNNANLNTLNIDYGLDNTNINISFNNIKTINNKEISGNFTIKTFALGKHHVSNVLAAVTTSLTLEINIDKIENNIANFKGLKGRSSKSIVVDSKTGENINIIEEINPGINVKAIESSIEMLNNLNPHTLIIGGDYGITCEEIDEIKLSKFLNKINKSARIIILTGDLGKNINKKLDKELKYIENPINAKKEAIKLKKDILFIFRSNYSQLDKR